MSFSTPCILQKFHLDLGTPNTASDFTAKPIKSHDRKNLQYVVQVLLFN